MWVFSRYNEATEILKASGTISKQITRIRPSTATHSPMDLHMLNQDPPHHTRLRELIMGTFSAANIKSLESHIAKVADELIQNILNKKEADFIADFAQPLPVIVIAELMGVPEEDRHMFRNWSSELLIGYDSVVANPEILRRQQSVMNELILYFTQLIQRRRAEPDGKLISHLILAHDQHQKLTSVEIVAMCMLMLVAGHETTLNLLGTGLLCLFNHPDQFTLLKERPEYLPSAIEEMLRFESPAQRSTFRITAEEIEIGGKHLQKGEQICAVIGSANHDPEQFENPDKFDITRSPNRHLAFGLGIHFCPGSILARAEARIGFSKILEYLPNIQLATNHIEWNNATLFRGLRKLPISI